MLSASTILIISGFLVGLTVGKIVAEEISPYVLSCGLAGFLVFIVLDQTANRRVVELQEQEKNQMEERLNRHVNSLSSVGFTLPPAKNNLQELAEELSRDGAESRDVLSDTAVI
ncbi:MAG: hypothetical protein R3C01_17685 [Planctomycetaceae bacterium]